MKRRLIFVCLALALSPVATAQVVVLGDWVTLGDVAPVTGDAAKVLLAPSPAPGQTLSLDPKFLIEAARRADIVLAIPLDKAILVSRTTNASPQTRQAPIAKSAPPAPQAPVAADPGLSRAPVAGWIVVLIRDVARGAKISAADVERAAAPPGASGRNTPEEMDAVVGREARRLLKAGQPLLTVDLKSPSVIRKGDPVRLVYASEGLRLCVDGQAQGDAAIGEAVRVLNRYSKRSIDAVATAEGEARVSR